jgi:phosphoglycerate dehydrogenase-like enzyme
MRVHITRPGAPPFPQLLSELLDNGIDVTTGPDVARDCEVLVAGVPTREQLEASEALRALVIPWAGLPRPTREVLRDRADLPIYNIHHNAQPTAECAVALMFAAAKSLVPIDAALRRGDWRPRYEMDRSLLLFGKTALVLGYGAIGARIARICRGVGMDVHATRKSDGKTETLDDDVTLHPASALQDLLPRADVLFVALPYTHETDGLIGAAELALLPRSAILINVGRGHIIDERSLYEALRDKRLAAAAIDTWYEYPKSEGERERTFPGTWPFHELDNVVMSPHRGGHCAETERLRAEHLGPLLNQLARGEEPATRVLLARGY